MTDPPAPGPAAPTEATSGTLHLLRDGQLEVVGRLVDASNATLFCRVRAGDVSADCVYKPVAGERPLWDFPEGTLGRREVAAYLLATASGWPLVPPTVWRPGGPFGPGMCQLWVEEQPRRLVDVVPAGAVPRGWRHVLDARGPGGREVSLVHADDPRLRRMAVLDAVLNNADRKGGHVLCGPEDAVFGVDHGVCFHVEDKLRTVLWGWAGEPLDPELTRGLRRLWRALTGRLGGRLRDLLHPEEVTATTARLEGLLAAGTFPLPGTGWPAIPWPAI
ncbi:MAG: SCO1664 family protein [Actinomycetota bacterium]